MNEAAISIEHLSRTFGENNALNDISLAAPKGCVFGLVGANGAGKSTLIKHILGLWRAEAGSVSVFGDDPVSDPVSVLKRVGYLSEEPDLPGWMKIDELMRYTQTFYPNWDDEYAESLLQQFALDKKARIKTLSKGQRTKAALLIAQAHRPELLLLDEPSSGLDPIVRADILTEVIRTVASEGRTVFFSSHFLDEIERVSDYIAFLHQGQLVLCGSIDDVKGLHRNLTVRFDNEKAQKTSIQGIYSIKGSGRERAVICNLAKISIEHLCSELGCAVIEDGQATLDEIFFLHAALVLRAEDPRENSVDW